MMEKLNFYWNFAKEKMLDRDLDIELRIGTMFISFGGVSALLGMLCCIMAGVPIAGTLAVFAIFCSVPLIMFLSMKLGAQRHARQIMVTAISILIPVVYLTSGGIHSGCTIWFVYELFFITLALRGKKLAFHLSLASVLDIGCFIIEYFRPELVFHIEKTWQVYVSVCGSAVIVVICMVLTVIAQKRLYILEKEAGDRKQEKLELANLHQKNFLANMSHEIRSPINGILGMNEMILRSDDPEEIRRCAANVESAGAALLSIVNDILDFSKLESGNMEIVDSDYEVMTLINDCYNMINGRAQERHLEFRLMNDPKIPHLLRGDEMRVRQVISNLLTNAVKYTDEGFVELKAGFTRLEGNHIVLEITVSDSGKGIAEEDREKMFEQFHRLNLQKNRSIEGTGLGLPIVKRLIDLMGGTIELDSRLDEGSAFTVKIPQLVVDESPMGTFDAKNFAAKVRKYKESFRAPDARILVVDDMKMNLLVVKGLLKQTGIQMDMALSGAESVKLCKRQKYDLILMDHMMPNMDGVEAFRLIRQEQDGLNNDTPVIMLTANAIVGADKEYLETGFDDYLSKPIRADLLEQMIRKYLPAETVQST